jgi:hypothetical protein
MADLEDLNYTSIIDMETDEALETLRLIRLARRTPVKQTRTITKKSVSKTTMSATQAEELLKMLKGD